MATLNYGTRQLDCKIVYYGPALGGKTTNLTRLHQFLPAESAGELTNLATRQDRTLYFDLLPVNLGRVGDYYVKVHLFTVPGQVYYNATRRVVLSGVDGVVMVFDSSPDRESANYQSLANLEENLQSHGLSIDSIPIVFQYNKRDLPDAMDLEFMSRSLNPEGLYEEFAATALHGEGVQETLKSISSQVFSRIEADLPSRPAPRPIVRPAVDRAADATGEARPETELDAFSRLNARGPHPAPEAMPGPRPQPPFEGPGPLRIRQLSDLSHTGLKLGHAVVDLSPVPPREGAPDLSAMIEFRPAIGNTRLEKARYWKLSTGSSDPDVEVFESRPVAGERPSRLWRVGRADGSAEIYLHWPTLLGRLELTPEGRKRLPAVEAGRN